MHCRYLGSPITNYQGEPVFELVLNIAVTPVPQPRVQFGRKGFGKHKGAPAAYLPSAHPIHGFKNDIMKAAFRERERIPGIFWPVDGPLDVIAVYLVPRLVKNKKSERCWATAKPDLDNYLKGSMDACNGLIWKDDCQVVSEHALKIQHGDWEVPRFIMVIRPAGDIERRIQEALHGTAACVQAFQERRIEELEQEIKHLTEGHHD